MKHSLTNPKTAQGSQQDFFIEDHDASGVNVTQVVLRDVFRTQDEAIIAAYEAGKQKIDSGWRPEPVPAQPGLTDVFMSAHIGAG